MGQTEATSTLAEGTAGAAAPHLSQGEQVERILRGGSAPSEQQPGTADPAEPEAPRERAPLNLKAIAEQSGVELADLYRELKISVGDGQEVSLEDVKGRYKDTTQLEEDRKSVVKLRGELEADRIAQQRELAKLKAVTPAERADPQMAQVYEQYKADYISRERESMLRAIPEWAEPAVVVAERKQLQDYLATHGGWPADTVDQIDDHRLFVTLRQAVQDRKELGALKAEKAKAEQPREKIGIAPRRGGDSNHRQQVGGLKTAVAKGQMTATEAVNRLLKGR